MFAQLIDAWSEALAWVWISSVPRQAALILGVALLIRSQPKMAAAWRHWIWFVAALAIGLIPLAAAWLPRLPLIPAEWVYGEDAMAVSQVSAAVTPASQGISPHYLTETASFGWLEWSFLVWFVGAFLLIARLGMGLLGLRSFQRDRLPVVSGRLCARLEHCRRLGDVTTLVDLYLSRRSQLPMTWGVVRPAINLPEEAENWSDERLDAVFLHELGHIQRADCWSNMVLKVVCALNWFNPFVWMAARRTYLAQEVACDDFACSRLLPSNYARHLLELTAVVKDFHRSEIEPAVGLSSCDHLRLRVAAALDPDRSRACLPSRTASLMSGAVFLSMGLMAMVSLRFVEEAHAVQHLKIAPAALKAKVLPPQESTVAEETASTHQEAPLTLKKIGDWIQALPQNLEAAVLKDSDVDESRQESSLFIPREDDEVEPIDEAPAATTALESGPPNIVPAVVVQPLAASSSPAQPIIVKPRVVQSARARALLLGLDAGALGEIDWRSFSRPAGSRRGRTIVLNHAESVCNRYARMAPMDRKREGSFRNYLKRNGVHLNDAGIRRLIQRTQRNQL